MTRIEKLGIVGVGLIGGSAALAARRAGIAERIVGVGRTQANLDVALERGIVDEASREVALLAGCDFVLLATPVRTLAANAAEVAQVLPANAVVTDGGSVKGEVVRDCMRILGARFVGSHPIAGTEDSGAAAADVDLYRDSLCVVTPNESTDSAVLARVRWFWQSLGMRLVEMSPRAHDRVLAITSHLPHLAAFSLARLGAEEKGGVLAELIGPSFRDMTRVAASSPEMWRDILLSNADLLDDVTGRMIEELEALRLAARRGDGSALEDRIRGAAEWKRRTMASGETALDVRPASAALSGVVQVPGDKAIGHRALLFAGIADGDSTIRGLSPGEDNSSTVEVLRGLGVEVEREGDEARVRGRGLDGLKPPAATLDCGNSGTTMRFCTGLLAGRPFDARLDGDASLRGRPMARLEGPLGSLGARIETSDGRPPLFVRGGKLHAADVVLDVASAQLKTAVLLAGLQAEGKTTLSEPSLSRDHTERLLPQFGVPVVVRTDGVISVEGPARLCAADIDVPRDPSAAAFWIVAASIVPGSEIRLPGIAVNPTRIGAFEVLEAMGASIEQSVRQSAGPEPVADLVIRSARLRGTRVAGDLMVRAIDEFPILAVAAAYAEGDTSFADGSELRLKETDRLSAMADGLSALGVEVEEGSDGIVIRGSGTLRGGIVDSRGDHRIAMAFAIAALGADAPVRVRGADAVAVSDPAFVSTLEMLRTAEGE